MQSLWTENVEGVVPQRKAKVLLPEGETDAGQDKAPLSTLSILLLTVLSIHRATGIQAFQTALALCCHSGPLPQLADMYKTPAQSQILDPSLEIPIRSSGSLKKKLLTV